MDSHPRTDGSGALAERPFAATLGKHGPLTAEWLAAMPDVIARLECARHPRIADLGCGPGWSTLALAHAFLDAHVDGLDTDAGSIADAQRHAAAAGLDGRVRFLHAEATELAGPYDLIVIVEALHDLARPVDALAAARAALAADGTVLVVAAPVLCARAVRELAGQAGLGGFDVLSVQNDFFRLYRLHP